MAIPISAAPNAGDPNAQSYSAQGVVEQIAPDQATVKIHHQNIPGYMMEMTMDFPVQNTNELSGISPAIKSRSRSWWTEKDDWVENIHRVGHAAETTTNAMPNASRDDPELKPGDILPDYELTAEDGKQIHFADFRGKVLAFTFFYSRCPLPNYCPLMNNNFRETRKLLWRQPTRPPTGNFFPFPSTRILTRLKCCRITAAFIAATTPTAGSSPPLPQKPWRISLQIST